MFRKRELELDVGQEERSGSSINHIFLSCFFYEFLLKGLFVCDISCLVKHPICTISFFKKVSCLCRTESFGFEDEEVVSCGSNGGRRESNGRTRTKDPCLGKMALGEIRMMMRRMIMKVVMVMITIENQDQGSLSWQDGAW